MEDTVDLSHVARLAVEGLRASPAAVVAIGVRVGPGAYRVGSGAAGRLWDAEDAPPARLETPFDLASVTKPVTALTLARLERRGLISRQETLADVLPGLRGTRSADVPLDLFASHRAGLDGHRPLYAPLTRGEPVDLEASLRIAADARREGCDGSPPIEGFPCVYSDLGYLLLGAALAARAGAPLDDVARAEVLGPLGLQIGSARWHRGERATFDRDVASTETVAWRGGAIRGAVHDENAWALGRDGMCGHAGLFGDARSVLDLGLAVLDALAGAREPWLRPEDLAPVLRVRPNGSHRAGFDSRTGDAPSSGSRFGPGTFGHLGFTGTSLWIDPDRQMAAVLLTNRVCPTRAADAIRRARPAVYDAMVDAMIGPAGEDR